MISAEEFKQSVESASPSNIKINRILILVNKRLKDAMAFNAKMITEELGYYSPCSSVTVELDPDEYSKEIVEECIKILNLRGFKTIFNPSLCPDWAFGGHLKVSV